MSSTSKILIDFEKIKDPFSGLGQFCAHLKIYFDQSPSDIAYWIPNKFEKLAKKVPFILPRTRVFHAIHQDSPYVPWSKKTKYVLTIHDLNALSENNNELFKRNYVKGLQKKIDRASMVTFISEFTRNEVEKIFDLKDKKTEIIYNGISLPHNSTTPKLVPDSKFIFAIGTVLPKKNFHVLIDFLKELPKEFKIVLAGTTFHSYAQDMIKRINDEGLNDRFFLVGTISDTDKRWYYEHACAFIFPSLLEGFGLPVAEAMSLGVPLFISDKTSLPEIGGAEAIYFKHFEPKYMADVFLSGLSGFDQGKKEDMIKRSALFNWQKAAERYLSIYKSL